MAGPTFGISSRWVTFSRLLFGRRVDVFRFIISLHDGSGSAANDWQRRPIGGRGPKTAHVNNQRGHFLWAAEGLHERRNGKADPRSRTRDQRLVAHHLPLHLRAAGKAACIIFGLIGLQPPLAAPSSPDGLQVPFRRPPDRGLAVLLNHGIPKGSVHAVVLERLNRTHDFPDR